MDIAISGGIFISAWMMGCLLFDKVFELRGAWLMFGGVVTFIGASTLAKAVHALAAGGG